MIDRDAWHGRLELSEARPYADGEDPFRPTVELSSEAFLDLVPMTASVSRQGYTLRVVLFAFLIGYLIGRWRVVLFVLRLFHQKWGHWL